MTITTPVEIGKTVWFIENNMVESGKLTNIAIFIDPNHRGEPLVAFRYTVERANHNDPAVTTRCFQTKADLLASL